MGFAKMGKNLKKVLDKVLKTKGLGLKLAIAFVLLIGGKKQPGDRYRNQAEDNATE